MPANYTLARKVGSFVRASGAIVLSSFSQAAATVEESQQRCATCHARNSCERCHANGGQLRQIAVDVYIYSEEAAKSAPDAKRA